MKVSVSENSSISLRTGKLVTGTLPTSVRDRMLICDHQVAGEDFRILGNESKMFILELKENVFIKSDKPTLNRDQFSQELSSF